MAKNPKIRNLKGQKRIAVIGDSWGDPKVLETMTRTGQGPSYHTVNLLRRAGHKVYQFAEGGKGNLPMILQFIENPPPRIDWIIVFQTEAFRDYNGHFGHPNEPFDIYDKRDEILEFTYREIERIRNHYDARVALIGGQAHTIPQYQDIIKKVEFHIEDWRRELLGSQVDHLEGTHTLCHPYLYESKGITNGAKHGLKCVQRDLEWVKFMNEESELFPDFCHPGGKAHTALTKRLLKVIET